MNLPHKRKDERGLNVRPRRDVGKAAASKLTDAQFRGLDIAVNGNRAERRALRPARTRTPLERAFRGMGRS